MRELPKKTDPHVEIEALPAPRARADSSGEIDPSRLQVVAVATPTPETMRSVRVACTGAPFTIAGPDALVYAGVVLLEGTKDVAHAVAQIRARARTDAAIICMVKKGETEIVEAAHAAGAFACIRHPFTSTELVGLIGSALDATAAKVRVAKLTEQLDLHAHLAAIGRMSAGLTHELNNPLTVALVAHNFLRNEVARLVESERLLRAVTWAPVGEREEALHAARAHLAAATAANEIFGAIEDTATSYERIQGLLSNLRLLVGQGQVRLEHVDLLEVVREVRRWAAQLLQGIKIEEEGGPLVVVADRLLLRQIVLNLATNAAHAARSLSAPRIRFHVYPSAGRGVVSVRDNGPGIPEEMQDKIFEPFFTTRRGRGGTGLGLSLCREFARQMNADISFWSVLGRGACFRVHLPLASETS